MPSYTILPTNIHSDLPTHFTIAHDALSQNGPWAAIFPHGYSPSAKSTQVSALLADLTSSPSTRERNLLYKAVDDATGEILGTSRWILYPTPESLEDDAKKGSAYWTAEPEGMDLRLRRKFVETAGKLKGEIMEGKAFLYLQLLAVRREAQGRGVGTGLVEEGVTRADELGVECYVESSVAGRRVYEKSGFRFVRDMVVQGYEGDERMRHFILVRPAKHKVHLVEKDESV